MGSIFQVNESNGNVTITGAVDVGSHQIHSVTDPTSAQDAATKNYVDGLINGLSWKNPVLAATTTAGTLATSFANGSVIDGITLATGNRILIKNQAAPAENGIYTVNASGAPTRSLDMNTWAEVPAAATIVETGTVNADLAYVCTSDPGGTIGTTAITFVNFASISGGVTSITGTTNQVIVSTPTGAVTLSLPQSIAVTSSPTFASLTLTSPLTVANGGTGSSTALANGKLMASSGGTIVESAITSTTTGSGSVVLAGSPTLTGTLTVPIIDVTSTTNQLVLGTTNTVTVSSTAPSASRTYTLPDAGGAANFILDKGNYTLTGTWTNATLVTPALGTPSSATLTNATGLPLTTGVTGILPNANTTATSNATASTIVSRDANANTKVNNLIENFTTTATAAGTTVLTAATSPIQQFTGTSTQTVTLPDCTTLSVGFQITVLNRSTNTVTVNNNGGSVQQAMTSQSQTTFTCTNIGSANGTWDVSTSSGSGAAVNQYANYVVGTASGTYTGSTTVFAFPFTYVQDGKSLQVYYNGQQLIPTNDYAETTNSSFTTTSPLVVGGEVVIRTISPGAISASVALFRENYVVGTALNNYTGSSTVFNLVNSYTVGGNVLMVTLDGDVQTVGATIDYLETNSTTVTFNNTLVTGQKVSFIWSQTTATAGTVNTGTTGQLAYYPSSTNLVSGASVTLTQLMELFAYRRPVLQFVSGTVVSAETGLDGNASDSTILFPDGQVRSETAANRLQMTISQNAVFTNATLASNQGGLRTGSATNNSWYACYAVKVTTFSANWVLVADSVLPTQSNYATLNTNFGTNGWVYLGMIRYGNNSGVGNAILDFIQVGNFTMFRNVGAQGDLLGTTLVHSLTVTTATYTTTSGTTNTDIPVNLGVVQFSFYCISSATLTDIEVTNAAGNIIVNEVATLAATGHEWVQYLTLPRSLGLSVFANATSSEIDINLSAFYDGVLGIGSNPQL